MLHTQPCPRCDPSDGPGPDKCMEFLSLQATMMELSLWRVRTLRTMTGYSVSVSPHVLQGGRWAPGHLEQWLCSFLRFLSSTDEMENSEVTNLA